MNQRKKHQAKTKTLLGKMAEQIKASHLRHTEKNEL